ncbi:hypothetical protein BHU72_14975 [Desulfuribacillus stibiiarsenatis]|uniref:DUF1819 domain-containing protein n=1 Tax=Desulfuribacillus stibiiarsenatis TaxID=1390249 RepID=A0A1E5L745_9FIRM|nr:DUF1819 family protein [Desulfuribacillus stibiiarsenatis]OEH85982.1 hypothetical protein BHU72_14975 [Desulfuribacillus stibiiarsenatis]
MSTELLYSANLTGAAFLFYEFKQVIRLKQEGLNDKEIKDKIVTENVFQYEKTSSLQRMIPTLLRRTEVIDDTLRTMVLEDSMEVGKVINLYAIMKTDRLYYEFMDEVIKEKLHANDHILEKKDINAYFTHKAEQDEKVASWTDKTNNKLKQVFIKILLETGILKDKRTWELNRMLIDEQVKEHLRHIGDEQYISAMGE